MLKFQTAKSKKDLQEIYDHNMSAFFDTDEFDWKLSWLESQKKEGWDIIGVSFESEIIAAVFLKKEKNALWSKHTPVKMSHQGNGFSHEIKNYIESVAKDKKLKNLHNFCAIDNFRMVALNESHGYKKTGEKFNDSLTLVEWKKTL